ncbi:MAG: hypothetical protein IJX27_08230 [Clostridia bacterium]|nr:hypothetical protein [Clostridia bacterium]
MLNSIKEIKKEIRSRKNEHKKDSDGRVLVDLRVINDESFLSPYSTENHNIISEELSDFIEHSLAPVPGDKPIHFRIFSDVITEEEQKEYCRAIHSHYGDKYRYTIMEKKKLHKLALIMSLVAIGAMAFMIGIDISGARVEIFTEIIDIFAWVFMWEAVDIFFLQCTMLNFKQKRYLRLYDSIIEYLPLKDCYGEKHGGCDE